MDYTLEIDFDVFTDKEIKPVLSILYYSSSLCFEDIRMLGSNLILRMEQVGFNLRLKVYLQFSKNEIRWKINII